MAIQKISNAVIADDAVSADNIATGAITVADIDFDGKVSIDGTGTSGGVVLEIVPRDGASGVGYINFSASVNGNRLAAVGVPSLSNELVFDLYNPANDALLGRKLRITDTSSIFQDDVYSGSNRLSTDSKAIAFSIVFGG